MFSAVFKKMDQALAEQAEKAKTTPYWLRFEEFLNQVNEDQIFIIKYVVIAVIIMVPLSVILFASSINSGIRSQINTRINTLRAAQEIIDYNQVLTQKGFDALSPKRVDNQNEIVTRLSQLAGQAGFPSTSLSTSEFENIPGEGPEVMASNIKVKFNALSSTQIYNLLSILSDQDKAIFKQIRIDRNEQNSLDGILGLQFLYRSFGAAQ